MSTTENDRNEGRVTTIIQSSSVDDLAQLIDSAAALLDTPDHQFFLQSDALRNLLERLKERRFHLAVLGQFKRGKSTLLNALLGEEALPSSVIPLTAIPTFIEAGDQRSARVLFENGNPPVEYNAASAEDLNEFLSHYVSEEANPANKLGVSHVEVSHPATILRSGVILIDTPGIGSTHRHNTEVTLNFIPQCDAALFVLSPDPPITEVEIEFLKEVRARISRVFYVMSKTDYLGSSDKNKILTFLREVLHQQAGIDSNTTILPVSARLGLEAKLRGDNNTWIKSGMNNVESLLIDFLVHEKEDALTEAVARKASDLVDDVLLEMRLSIQSLKMPLDELERRLEILKNKLAEADSQRTAEKDLLDGDRKRMVALLEDQAEHLRKKAKKRFLQVAQDALEQSNLNPEAAQSALAEVIPSFFEHELGEMSRAFETQVKEVLDRHRRRTDSLIESIRKNAAELFDIPYQPSTSTEEFEIKRRPYWVTHHWRASLSVLPEGFWDRFLPRGARKSRTLRRMCERIDVLVAENVENVRWPTLQSLEKSFREFASAIDARLEEAISATQGAILAAYEKRKSQSSEVESETANLEYRIAELEKIRECIHAYCSAS